jgi:hypothetical protein
VGHDDEHSEPGGFRKIWDAAVYAITTGLRRHGPDAVGLILFGLAAAVVALVSVLLLGTPPWAAGAGAAGATGIAAAWKRMRAPPRVR